MLFKVLQWYNTPLQDTVISSILGYELGPRSGSDVLVSSVKTEVNLRLRLFGFCIGAQ